MIAIFGLAAVMVAGVLAVGACAVPMVRQLRVLDAAVARASAAVGRRAGQGTRESRPHRA
ncbi:hypothetical protein CLV63_106112 [Murinocardiopsis flavida]|uniref:Uncharacterized protein n=1 Tax=Murinocardiopsis flavida TaxID=645275 RepID=A0A2P8DLG8_9ACTN|nr:hypothetical protein [Murinocardiopsis flavida]PSK98064.1 hypothetical protein CLV63_106112 [Murinocardiopsis flavida]